MDKTSRALRRFHRDRLKRRAYKILDNWFWFNPEDKIHTTQRRWNNMQICSCASCGNRRRDPWLNGQERLTLQERKALQAFNDEISWVDKPDDLLDNNAVLDE